MACLAPASSSHLPCSGLQHAFWDCEAERLLPPQGQPVAGRGRPFLCLAVCGLWGALVVLAVSARGGQPLLRLHVVPVDVAAATFSPAHAPSSKVSTPTLSNAVPGRVGAPFGDREGPAHSAPQRTMETPAGWAVASLLLPAAAGLVALWRRAVRPAPAKSPEAAHPTFAEFGEDCPSWSMAMTAEYPRTMRASSPVARTVFVAETQLPTSHGMFRVRSYRHTVDGITYTDPIAIMCGSPEGREEVPVRVHDACWTSEVLGSLKCDCAQQLEQALDFIRANDLGIVLYLHQEGRGIGLANKIAAYRMQELGMDTVAANRVLGFPDDSREYTAVKAILDDLDVRSVQLMTNNPRKVRELRSLGVPINKRLSCIVPDPGVLAAKYLSVKEEQMGHLLREEPDVEVLCPIVDRGSAAERFGMDGARFPAGLTRARSRSSSR
eukprot:EG_transcript_6507